jgi:hypothetical protein
MGLKGSEKLLPPQDVARRQEVSRGVKAMLAIFDQEPGLAALSKIGPSRYTGRRR